MDTPDFEDRALVTKSMDAKLSHLVSDAAQAALHGDSKQAKHLLQDRRARIHQLTAMLDKWETYAVRKNIIAVAEVSHENGEGIVRNHSPTQSSFMSHAIVPCSFSMTDLY